MGTESYADDLGVVAAAMEAGNWEQALKVLDAIPRDRYAGEPEAEAVWFFRRGTVLNMLDRYGGARDAFEQLKQYRAGWYEADYEMGIALLGLGEAEEALSRFEIVLKASEQPMMRMAIWWNIADAYYALGNWQAYLGALKEAVEEVTANESLIEELLGALRTWSDGLLGFEQYEEAIGANRRGLELARGLPSSAVEVNVAGEELGFLASLGTSLLGMGAYGEAWAVAEPGSGGYGWDLYGAE